MKQQKWDDSIESVKEFIEISAILPDDEPEERVSVAADKSRVTELRRRIEERMDSKRIALEYEYDEIDGLVDSLQ